MTCNNRDLTIETALSDPVIGAAMRADKVDPHHLEALLRSTAHRLEISRSSAALLSAAVSCRFRSPAGGSARAW